MDVEVLVLFGFLFVDLVFTYLNAYKVSKKDKKFWRNELNPITRGFMKRFGVHKGMRLAVVTTTLMMCGVIIYLRIRTNPLDFSRLIFFIMGAYALMSIIHVYMFKAIWGGK